MAFENVLRRRGRNRGRNRQIVSVPQMNWRGANYIDNPYAMPEHQLPYAVNADMGSPIGSISKVLGYEGLFASLGDGPVRGLHAWQHSDGDKLILAWDKYLYLLSGDTGSIAKGSQADWEEGAGTNIDTEASPGDIQIAKAGVDFSATATNTADFNGTHSGTVAINNSVKLQPSADGNTRYYIQNAAGGLNPTDRGAWNDTYTIVRKLDKTKYGSVSYRESNDASSTEDYDRLLVKAVSDGLPTDKTISGTLSWCLGVREDNASANFYYHVHAFVTSGDTNTVRGTLLSDYIGEVEWSTTALGLAVGAQAINSVNAKAGDRIVIEIGFCGKNTTYREFFGRIYYGGTNATDLTDGGNVTTYPGWFEFSSDPMLPNYVSSGIYTHPVQDLSGVGVTKEDIKIIFNKTTPANTACTVSTRISTNGGSSWGSWTERSSGDTLITAGTDVSSYRVQWRSNLSSTTGSSTPSLDDAKIEALAAYKTEAVWEYYYDLGVMPTAATLSYTTNAPAGTTLTWYAAASSNSTVFGDWQEVSVSGGAIPLGRYVQIRIVLTGSLTATPTVSDLLISYATAYTKPNRLDISPLGRVDNKLTGNRVRFQDYSDRCYCADGLRPFVLYVDDDIAATGTAQASTELITNNEFDTYTGTIDDDTEDAFTGWTNYNTGTGRTEAVTGDGGSGVAMKATQTDATAQDQKRGVMQERTLADMGLAVGDVISAHAKYKNNAFTGASAQILVCFRDNAGTSKGLVTLINQPTETADYTVVSSENITIPAGTTKIQFISRIWSSGAYSGQNNQLWVEYMSCVKADTITLAAGASAVDGFYNNAFITLTAGTGAGQVRFISDYNGTSKIAPVGEGWDTAPDSTSEYSISPAVKVRNAGVDPPTAAPSLADSGEAGSPSGAYRAKITFVNRDGYESNPSAASSSVSVSSKKITWTVPVDASAGNTTASRKLYRTKAGGSVYYYVATISDNSTTTYSDNIADSALTMLMLDNNNVPPNASIVYSFLTYMFYVNVDELWFSKPGEPENVPNITGDVQMNVCPAPILDLKSNPMALIPQGDSFIAPITTNSGFVFDSDPALDTTTMRVIDKNGCLSAEASDICIDPNLRSILVFPTNTGVRLLLPGLQEESIESVPLSRNIQKLFDWSVNRTNMAAVFHNSVYRISMEYRDPNKSENEFVTFAYDFRTSEWYGPWKYGMSCYAITGGVLYGGDATKGIVHRMDTGSSFNEENIEMIVDLPVIAPGGEDKLCKFLDFMVMLSAESDTSELVVMPKVDEREVTVTPGTLESTFTGDPRPGHDTIRSRKFKIPLGRGSTMSLRFVDDSTNPLSIEKVISRAEILPVKR